MAVLTEREKRKRLTFTCGIGQGVKLVLPDGSTRHVRVRYLQLGHGAVELVVDDQRVSSRKLGEGITVGDCLVNVQKIGVEGHARCELLVSAPYDVMIVFDRGQ